MGASRARAIVAVVRASFVVLAAVMGCSERGAAPRLDLVEPRDCYNDEALVLVLRGSFEVPVQAELGDLSRSRLSPYRVQLVSGDQVFDLPPGEFRGTGRVEAPLEPGTPPGLYAVRVTDPWGRSTFLPDALTVRFRFVVTDGGIVDIDEPDAGPLRAPPQARFTVLPPYDIAIGFQVEGTKVDASPSDDAQTPATDLNVSWNFSGATAAPLPLWPTTAPPWTRWTTTKTTQDVLPYGVTTVVVAARDADGDIGYGARAVSVVDNTEFCFVTTPLSRDDGASGCADEDLFGDDRVLSLDEARRLTSSPQGNETIVLLADPAAPATFTGDPITIDSVVQIVGMPGAIIGREIVAGNAPVTFIGLAFVGPGAKLTVPTGMKAVVLDSSFRDAGIVSAGQLIVERTRFEKCAGTCIAVNGAGAELIVTQSSFDGAAGDEAIDAPECIRNGNGFALDLVGNTFTGFSTGVRIGAGCARPTRIVHDTFHANGLAVDYLGGNGHVLRNNIFTAQQIAAVRGCDLAAVTFASDQRRDHLLYGNASAGCIGADPGIVNTHPLYVSSTNRDFRLRFGSPAVNAAPDLGLDANGPAPNRYLGSGPDFGGRETY